MNKVYVFDPTKSDKLSSVRGVGRYLQILKENFPDWSFTDTLHATRYTLYPIFINPFFNFLQKPLTMKRLAQKQIAVIHDLVHLKYPSHFPAGIRGNINVFLNRISLKNYDLIITDSEASKKDIIDILRLPEEKIKVIYPCLPKSFLNPKFKSQTGRQLLVTDHYCLYVGDATWNKNLVNLARAIKIINVTCVFVGKIFDQKTRRLLDSLNNKWLSEYKEFLYEAKDDKRFIFAGFLTDSELIKLYQQTEVNVLPSRAEGFGFSFLEAASQGCPSIMSDIPVLKEISGSSLKGQFLKGQNLKGPSLFFDPENPHDIADKIGEIYFNKELRNIFGRKAKKRSEFFSQKKFKNAFRTIVLD